MSYVEDYDDEPLLPEDDDPDLASAAEDELPPDEGDGDGALQQDDEPPARDQQRQPGRRESRVAALARDRRAERERADRLEREVAELRGRVSGNQNQEQQREAERREAEALQYMSADEKVEYYKGKLEQQVGGVLQQQNLQIADIADRTEFATLVQRNPTAAKMADEVERTLAAERAQGRNWSRKAVLSLLLGQRQLERAPKQVAAQRRAAAQGVERERTTPGRARSDVSSSGSGRLSEREARRKRLESQSF